MRLGIIADTHDHIEHTKRAMAKFESLNVDKVIHCGDFCSPFMMQYFKSIETHAVFGNNDGDLYLLQKKASEFGVVLHGGFAEFELESIKIALYHGTHPQITKALILSGIYDVVLSGHTHEIVTQKTGKTLHLNPGSCNGFGKEPQCIVLNLPDLSYSLSSI